MARIFENDTCIIELKMTKKIKVVLLSQYWSDEMAEMVGRKHYFRELAPWIQEKINLFKDKNDIELHVVAPNYASNRDINAYRDNIHFHYYHYSPTGLSILLVPLFMFAYKHDEPYKMAERLANMMTGYIIPARRGANIIRNINPDLIHLIGSEVSDYGYTAMKLMQEYPILLSVQGWAYLQTKSRNPLERAFELYREYCERIINKNIKFITSSTPKTPDEMRRDNEVGFFAKCEKVYFCRAITKIPQANALKTEKKYDIAFYARITKDKGIEDLIEALVYLNNNGRKMRTIIMGRGNATYIQQLKEGIRKKGLEEQINFAGFIENHEDVYNFAAQARLLVLPTHNDGIPNTIREAMFMGLPVVANNVGGIPRFNEHRHCVHLTELGDIKGLAESICKVIDDETYRNELIKNAHKEAIERYSPDTIYDQTIFAYKDIVENLNNAQKNR